MAPQLTSETLIPVLPSSLYFLILGAAVPCPAAGTSEVAPRSRPATPSPTAPEAIDVMNWRLFNPDMLDSPWVSILGLFHSDGGQGRELGRQRFAFPPDDLDGEGLAAPRHGGQQAADLGQLISGRELVRLRVEGEPVFIVADEEGELVA